MDGRRLRRMLVLATVALVLALVAVVIYVARDVRAERAIFYDRTYIQATPSQVCPGQQFTFPVSVVIDRPESVARVTEGWCRASDGICPKALQEEPVYYNFIDPYRVETTATRTAPAGLTPGDWQLRHCNESHSTGLISVACYQVAVTVPDSCE